MPNYCTNQITIVGHAEDLAVIERERVYSFFKDVSMTRKDTTLSINCKTEWKPPVQFLLKLLELYPRSWIKNAWSEEGGYAGIWIAFNQEQLKVRDMVWLEPSGPDDMELLY
jgi:hypothetical protein